MTVSVKALRSTVPFDDDEESYTNSVNNTHSDADADGEGIESQFKQFMLAININIVKSLY